MQNKECFEMILHAEQVIRLQIWKGSQKQNIYFLEFDHGMTFYPPNFEGWVTLPTCNIISNGLCSLPWKLSSFQIKKQWKLRFWHFLGNAEGLTIDCFFYASHIHHNFLYKEIPKSGKLKYF